MHTLLKARAVTAQQAYESTLAAYEGGNIALYVLLEANKELAQAQTAASKTNDAKIAAVRQYVDRAKGIEERLKKLIDLADKVGEAEDYYLAKYHRQTAEIMLLEARLAQQGLTARQP